MDVEERGGEFVKDKDRAVIVGKRSLDLMSANSRPCERNDRKPTKPRENTAKAVIECAHIPGPKILKCSVLTTKSHRKYPAAKAWIKPLAPV